MSRSFPDNFTWGVATSAYQIEGGRADGKGESIWDRFALTSDRMPETGDFACDHYHRYREDVALMARLGINAYRFSIAWTRVIPEGAGKVNPAGLGFYDHLVDELLANGITPWVTLYHWDLPQSLQDLGGWPERATVDAFVNYTDVVSRTLGDRVKNWITHNEPWVASVMGYIQGTFAPGLQDWPAGLAAAHHLLLSHGRAVPVIRSNVPDGLVGISPDAWPATAASNSVEDIDAARHYDGHRQRWFLDPIFGFGYPQDIIDDYLQAGYIDNDPPSWLVPGDLEEMAAPIDFLGLNYYGSHVISTHRTGNALEPGPNPPATHTEMGWEITPWALTDYLEHLDQRYKPAAIFITENGASYSDAPGEEGQVEDHRRISYLASHIEAVEKAIAAGVPVEGYFVWSLFDNLEWTQGFSQRFGLVWVDHRTGERTPKLSFQWYAEVIARGGLPA